MTDNNPKSTFAKRVRAARPRARRYDGWDDVISGLGLRVATSGHRSFFLRRTVRGRIRSATIGSADDMTLPEARAEARKLIASLVEPARKGNGRRGPSAGSPATVFFAFDKYTFSTRLSADARAVLRFLVFSLCWALVRMPRGYSSRRQTQ